MPVCPPNSPRPAISVPSSTETAHQIRVDMKRGAYKLGSETVLKNEHGGPLLLRMIVVAHESFHGVIGNGTADQPPRAEDWIKVFAVIIPGQHDLLPTVPTVSTFFLRSIGMSHFQEAMRSVPDELIGQQILHTTGFEEMSFEGGSKSSTPPSFEFREPKQKDEKDLISLLQENWETIEEKLSPILPEPGGFNLICTSVNKQEALEAWYKSNPQFLPETIQAEVVNALPASVNSAG